MVQKDDFRFLPEALQPGDQAVLVRMAADAGQGVDLCFYLYGLVEKLDAFRTVHQDSAEGSHRLIADEKHRALRSPEVVLQVMAYTSRITHTAGRDDYLRRLVFIDGDGVLLCDGQFQPGKDQRVDSRPDRPAHVLIQIVRVALQEDPRGLDGERAVHIHREVTVSPDQLALFDLPDKIQNLLCSANREGGDDHVSAAIQGFLDTRGQLCHIIHPLGAVEPVAVGGFDHEIIRLLDMLRVLQDRLVGVAHISAEADFPSLSILLQPDLDGRGAQKVAYIRHADADGFVDLDRLAVGAGAKLFQDSLRVFHGVDRLGS